MGFNSDFQKDIISVFNNERCTDEDVKNLTFIDSKGFEVPLRAIGEMTTWKEEAVKDIGGEDAFNQEYGLRFINSSKSLLNEAIIDSLLNNIVYLKDTTNYYDTDGEAGGAGAGAGASSIDGKSNMPGKLSNVKPYDQVINF